MTDLSPETRTLLELAREGDGANDDDRERVRRGLAAALGAGAFATTSATAAAKAGAGAAAGTLAASAGSVTGVKFAAWVAVGLATGLGGVTAAMSLTDTDSPAPELKTAVTAPAPRIAEPPPPHRSQDKGIAAVAPEPGDVNVSEPIARTPAGPVTARSPERAAGPIIGRADADRSSLLLETRLIERAQTALAQGNPKAALDAVRDHQRLHPNGALLPERLAAQAVALCKLGDRDGASRVAAELKRVAPASPLWPRVQQACSLD